MSVVNSISLRGSGAECETKQIQYRKGYKYQLEHPARIYTGIFGFDIKTDWVCLDADGWLYFRKGYAWDGASGPTIDTPDSMRASLAHDGLYQLIAEKLLPESFRRKADVIFRRLLKEDGMWWLRRRAWFRAVREFGGNYLGKGAGNRVYVAPKRVRGTGCGKG